jgi:hypothetical protein
LVLHIKATTAAAVFGEGDMVWAAFGGTTDAQWHKGTVSAVLQDGSYDVLYDDGDEDEGLSACYLKARGAAINVAICSSQQLEAEAEAEGTEAEAEGTEGTEVEAEGTEAVFASGMRVRALWGGEWLDAFYRRLEAEGQHAVSCHARGHSTWSVLDGELGRRPGGRR